jgi:hypothetical protein
MHVEAGFDRDGCVPGYLSRISSEDMSSRLPSTPLTSCSPNHPVDRKAPCASGGADQDASGGRGRPGEGREPKRPRAMVICTMVMKMEKMLLTVSSDEPTIGMLFTTVRNPVPAIVDPICGAERGAHVVTVTAEGVREASAAAAGDTHLEDEEDSDAHARAAPQDAPAPAAHPAAAT